MTKEILNRKANYDYTIEETIVCGIELIGSEVKSFRMRGGDITGGFCEIKDHLFLIGSNLYPLTERGFGYFEPARSRKLLVTKKEKLLIKSKIDEKGYSCVPLKIFVNDKGLIKVLIGIGKGKRNYDKKTSIKEKDIERETRAELKNN